MTETKRPEFNLHKKPDPLPDPSFLVVKTWIVRMTEGEGEAIGSL